jgi:hypothetical protein
VLHRECVELVQTPDALGVANEEAFPGLPTSPLRSAAGFRVPAPVVAPARCAIAGAARVGRALWAPRSAVNVVTGKDSRSWGSK